MKGGLEKRIEETGQKTGIAFGGRGRTPAGEGLLCISLATMPWSAHHASTNDCTVLMGIGHDSTQLYLDETRRVQAQLNRQEQALMKFKAGSLTEWDETGIRCERVKCSKPCTLCTAPCSGYRLQWNRWIMGVVRGDRTTMIVHQLPWKTSEAGGAGVPLSDDECDSYCLPHMGKRVINLTDGASPYEAFAGGQIRCSPDCDRKDCKARALKKGRSECNGMRPRMGRDRYKNLYKSLELSHGIVTHSKEEWAMIKEVRVWGPVGSKIVKLKHGTQVADGAWAELKQAVPNMVHSSDHERIADYVHAWVWCARRHGADLFTALGEAVAARR